jgi:nitrate reductase (NAD(P)H)
VVKKTKIGCVAGGTGITPCYQVIQAALKSDDKTELSLIFGNRTIDDILLREELVSFEENYKERFKLYFSVDVQPKEEWKHGVGFIT